MMIVLVMTVIMMIMVMIVIISRSKMLFEFFLLMYIEQSFVHKLTLKSYQNFKMGNLEL
jgi:hypothetical protein